MAHWSGVLDLAPRALTSYSPLSSRYIRAKLLQDKSWIINSKPSKVVIQNVQKMFPDEIIGVIILSDLEFSWSVSILKLQCCVLTCRRQSEGEYLVSCPQPPAWAPSVCKGCGFIQKWSLNHFPFWFFATYKYRYPCTNPFMTLVSLIFRNRILMDESAQKQHPSSAREWKIETMSVHTWICCCPPFPCFPCSRWTTDFPSHLGLPFHSLLPPFGCGWEVFLHFLWKLSQI